jgi:hypothetical protein
MTSIVITGLARDRAAALAKETAADLTVSTCSDYDGAIAVQSGTADYYLGVCQSGAGGAIALAIGLVGSKRARTVAPAGRPLDEPAIKTAIDEGVVAFGVALDLVDTAVPCIIRGLRERRR